MGYDLRDNLPRNAHFWQVGLLDIVLSEYPDKSHNFRNFICMTSHFSTLFRTTLAPTIMLNVLHNLRCVQTFHCFAYYVSHFFAN